MRNFYIYLAIFLTSVTVIICGLLFLLLNDAGSLDKVIPAEANLYLKTNSSFIKDVPSQKKALLYAFLENNSRLVGQKWKNSMENTLGSVGLFTIKNEFLGVTKANKQNLDNLVQNEIPYSIHNDFAFFPSFNHSKTYLYQESWYKDTKKVFNFSNLTAYIKDVSFLKQFAPELHSSLTNTLITAKIEKESIILNYFPKTSTKTNKKIKPYITFLPENTITYISNLETKSFEPQIEVKFENITNHVLTQLEGPVEYLQTETNFIIVAQKESNSLDSVFNKIKVFISKLVPEKSTHTLPDGTLATHLIADQTKIIFEEININDHFFHVFDLSDETGSVYISETESQIIIESSPDRQSSNNNLKTFSQSTCSLNTKNAVLLKSFNTSFLKQILLNSSKNTICID